jgi:hypothetical protein
MSRIRNIKPEFFSHEELQDMEAECPELHPMLVFSGLWTQCEWSGVFHWSIKKLKLSILPFLDFDLGRSLEYLAGHGFIKKFSRDGKDYGYVYNFTRYQAFSKKEKEQELRYPIPVQEELSRNNHGTIEQVWDCSGELPGEVSGSEDIGHRHRTKDIDINSFTPAEKERPEIAEAAPPVVETPLPASKPQKPAGKPTKAPLREREPENDYERVEKVYWRNWDSLFKQGKVKTKDPVVNWTQARALLKKHFERLKPDDITGALNRGLNDNFITQGGYSLAVMLSATVLNRLINTSGGSSGIAPPHSLQEKKSLRGLDEW